MSRPVPLGTSTRDAATAGTAVRLVHQRTERRMMRPGHTPPP